MAVYFDNEVFAVRDGEVFHLVEVQPTSGRWLAVMARSCWMPEGEHVPTRSTDGAKVEMAAIIACERNRSDGRWQWSFLSPPTKEFLGDMLFDSGAAKDTWYFVTIDETPAPRMTPTEMGE